MLENIKSVFLTIINSFNYILCKKRVPTAADTPIITLLVVPSYTYHVALG